MNAQRHVTLRGAILLLSVVAAIGNLYSWAAHRLGCSAGENSLDLAGRCDSVWMSAPAIGVLGAVLAFVVALRTSRRAPSALLLLASVALGLAPWIAFGDPAGNF